MAVSDEQRVRIWMDVDGPGRAEAFAALDRLLNRVTALEEVRVDLCSERDRLLAERNGLECLLMEHLRGCSDAQRSLAEYRAGHGPRLVT